MSAFTVSNIKPSLNIDANQRYILGLDEFPEPVGSIKVDNIFVPTLVMPAITKQETRNKDLSGFRWVHTTNSTDTFGSFILESFVNAASTGVSLLKFNQNGTITFESVSNFNSLSTFNDDVTFNGNAIFNNSISLPNNIDVTGSTQSFIYSGNAIGSFDLKNTQIPTLSVPTNTILKLSNSAANGGFEFRHIYEDVTALGFGKLVINTNNTFNVKTNYVTFGYSILSGTPASGTIVPNTTFGTVTDESVKATVAINGGVINEPNEATCLRVLSTNSSTKIELMNNAVGGNLHELRSDSDGSFSIKNRTTDLNGYKLDSFGNHISSGVSYMSRPTIYMIMQNNLLGTTIVTGNSYAKVQGITNTAARNAFQEPVGTNNRVTFAGNYSIFSLVNVSIVYAHNGGANDEVLFALYRDGVQIANSVISDTAGVANRYVQISITGHISFSPGEYLELFCTHPTSGRTITVKRLQLTIA
jgi:hypothetical protein